MSAPAPRQGGRPWKRALAWLALLGPFFFLSYGLANWWTGRLPHVASLWFPWEKHIPFWEWSILPYMSIDAFYAGSLFLCSTRSELDQHARRLLSATAISVAGFLLFPLQFAFVRPPTDGFNGALFAALAGFDRPFNQAPSLHVSLLMLLWIVYARHTRGALRWLIHIWFALIGVSVFTTYQHHAIDGIGGLVVGVLCLYLFPDLPRRWSRQRWPDAASRMRLLRRYLAASLACFAAAAMVKGWAWLLLWPGTSVLLVALAYGGLGPDIFQKHEGRLSWPAGLLLLPYLVGAWLSSRWLTRRCRSAQVAPGIWIGRAPGRGDWRALDVPAVLDLTAEFHAGPDALRRRYRNVPMLDLAAPSAAQIEAALGALDALHAHAPVLVHCGLGFSRSALIIAAWLLRRGISSNLDDAVRLVRAARPQLVLTPAQLDILGEISNG